jgi:hypothetical protein
MTPTTANAAPAKRLDSERAQAQLELDGLLPLRLGGQVSQLQENAPRAVHDSVDGAEGRNRLLQLVGFRGVKSLRLRAQFLTEQGKLGG